MTLSRPTSWMGRVYPLYAPPYLLTTPAQSCENPRQVEMSKMNTGQSWYLVPAMMSPGSSTVVGVPSYFIGFQTQDSIIFLLRKLSNAIRTAIHRPIVQCTDCTLYSHSVIDKTIPRSGFPRTPETPLAAPMFGVYCLQTVNFLCLFVFKFQCYVFHLYVGVRAGGGIGNSCWCSK